MRRRTVWLPTLWGWLLLLVLGAATAVFLVHRAGPFLAVDAPARGPDGRGARTLVVEGWLDPPELQRAIAVFRAGHYQRLVTTGGPIDAWQDPAGFGNYAVRAAALLRGLGLDEVAVVPVPAPPAQQDRTWHSAVALRDWAQARGEPLVALDVFTAPLHARRSRTLFRMVFADAVEVGVIGAQVRPVDLDHWWRSSGATKAVLGEALSLGWTTCCFWPPAAE